jgi:hypothetical protein
VTYPFGADQIERFRELIEGRLGLAFDASASGFLADVLCQRLEQNGESGDAYLRRLQADSAGAEWSAVGQLITVP